MTDQQQGFYSNQTRLITGILKDALFFFFACFVFVVTLSLFSFNTNDMAVMKLEGRVHNLVGPIGAYISYVFFSNLGLASYPALFFILVILYKGLVKGDYKDSLFKSCVSIFAVISIASLLHASSTTLKGVVFLPGGELGALFYSLIASQLYRTATIWVYTLFLIWMLSLFFSINLVTFFDYTTRGIKKACIITYYYARIGLLGCIGFFTKLPPITKAFIKSGKDIILLTKKAFPERKKNLIKEGAYLFPEELVQEDLSLMPPVPHDEEDNFTSTKTKTIPITDTKRHIDSAKIDDTKVIKEPRKNSDSVGSRAKKSVSDFSPIPSTILKDNPEAGSLFTEEELWNKARLLKETFKIYGVDGEVVRICPGPVITTFEFKPKDGVRLSKIRELESELAMHLKAESVRTITPIPGKDVVGVEIPNEVRQNVYLKDIIQSDVFKKIKSPLTIAIGKDAEGKPVARNLADMPHLLVAGSTGSGKSVGMNTMITSILMHSSPHEVKVIMIDPKKLEFSFYEGIPHLLLPVITEPKEAVQTLRWLLKEMERRYESMKVVGAKKIDDYNKKMEKFKKSGKLEEMIERIKEEAGCNDGDDIEHLPYVVVFIDELADLMMVAGKEIEAAIIRLAQLARAAGIHMVVATQRPSVDVVTGLIKANFPARISFKVATRADSKTILDTNGAERLLGKGDMLALFPGEKLKRVHGAYVTDVEIENVVRELKKLGKPEYRSDILKEDTGFSLSGNSGGDDLYDQAVQFVSRLEMISVSKLQRKFSIGYNKAAKIIEKMEEDGIVGPPEGQKGRKVLIEPL